TSFYDNYILYKIGIMSKNDWLNEVLSDINRLADSSGEDYMSLEEASFTAWTKYYRQNPNSHNVSISYYIKGFLLSLCMNISILEQTDGRKNLMHLMRTLYRKYHLKKNKGFTKQEFFRTAEEEFGFDLQAEFEQYISEKKRIPAEFYLDKLGIKLAKTMKKSVFPFEVKTESGKQIISKIFSQWSIPDLEIGDELIGINSRRVSRDVFEKLKLSLPDSSEAELILSRKGRIFYAKVETKMIYTYQIPYPVLEEDFEEIFRTNRIAECFFRREAL
ncbi:MAG TPA: M61 family peptidase, partial [Leptospiraceae bacterium]|nr:M61 family peptidase [Leptospiraceae bacterium]